MDFDNLEDYKAQQLANLGDLEDAMKEISRTFNKNCEKDYIDKWRHHDESYLLGKLNDIIDDLYDQYEEGN